MSNTGEGTEKRVPTNVTGAVYICISVAKLYILWLFVPEILSNAVYFPCKPWTGQVYI